MQRVLHLIGISGSGKSTYAKQLCKEDLSFVRINRDSIRDMLVGYKNFYKRDDVKQLENLVQKIVEQTTKAVLASGKNIVFDETNLNFTPVEADGVHFEYKVFDVPLEVAQNRVFRRDWPELVEDNEQEYIDYSGRPEVAYIEKQYQRFQNTKLRLGVTP